MNNPDETKKIDVTSAEILSIQSYIQQKNTAVLTIMFTDIKGFTEITEQKGEEYASRFRCIHDEILTTIIEKDGMGLIIKFIGDAVMAVFSEPSVAVERALLIQQQIDAFNNSQHEFVPMKVRIGLHMGQVSVANSLQADIFGRHVNRASRVEGLADGGQIYLSYSVFDSAKGWLAGNKDLVWQSHGRYLLKGIDEPIEIYEVLPKGKGAPKPPLHGQKQKTVSKLAVGILLTLLAFAIGTLGAMYYFQKAEVYFLRFYPENMYLDNAQPIGLAGQKTDSSRRVINHVKRGKHIVHYDVTGTDRYYAEIDVESDINNIELKFKELRLPELLNRLDLTETKQAEKNQSFSYELYGQNGEKVPYTAELNLELSSEPDSKNADLIHSKYVGSLKLNGKVYEIPAQSFDHKISDNIVKHIDPVLLYQDQYHNYYYDYYTNKTMFEFNMYAVFKPVVAQK